jgi:hypothetical protein
LPKHPAEEQTALFAGTDRLIPPSVRLRRHLVLPRALRREAQGITNHVSDEERGFTIIRRWADLEREGHLRRRETSLDADFLNEIFCNALGYKTATQSPERYQLEREFPVRGVGTVDGALGEFMPDAPSSPVAVIELKDAETDLDRDRSGGRTAVQQLWDYLNALPDCPWGIVSNFVSLRLYHRAKGTLTYEQFTLQELRERERYREFICLFERGGLLPSRLAKEPRAIRLLRASEERQREVGDELYDRYRENRLAIIHHLHTRHDKSVDDAIRIAQKLIDRIIFVAFCEDRELLPENSIGRAYERIAPFERVTNPRWRNFLHLFRAVDAGYEDIERWHGYNGGLFRHDPEVDDLQLSDEWTGFFKEVSTYDFRDEVDVDVLGHLFERSITELERLRAGAFFEVMETTETGRIRMPKSAERKRFGIYYTPPQFTKFLVEQTLGEAIHESLRSVGQRHGIACDDPFSPGEAANADYWREGLEALRAITVCDPACGSGAFLIRAYDVLDEAYHRVIEHLDAHDHFEALELQDRVSDMILADNLHGVDVSPQAVEIAQLSLWIRSAKRGKTLADLSKNVVCGNSLVDDPAVDPRALNWQAAFPRVFSRPEPGFDCVIGNPPWERLKVQEREFFAYSAPKIAEAVSAAKRRSLIGALENKNPELFSRYTQAKTSAERTMNYVRSSDRFPLTGKGDVNTYALFAEQARRIVAPTGRVGLLVPSGIATDHTTKEFFTELVESQTLRRLYDFENKEACFPDVHRSFKFCTLVYGGPKCTAPAADFVFFVRNMEAVEDPKRHIALSADDLVLLNPNTRTCPIFRSRRDAELTRRIYKRVPILVEHSRGERGNPWGVRFYTMFHQTNDAELFHTAEQIAKMGFKLKGNRWVRKKEVFLPLYEAKMVQMYDHRAAGVIVDTDNWMRQGQTVATSVVSHQKQEFVPLPRWWVAESEVSRALQGRGQPPYLCYKDVTSPTNERTMIAAFIPHVAVVNSAPLMFVEDEISGRLQCCLLANLNSFVLDFVARQKVGNVHLNFFIVEQLPVFTPDAYAERCPWSRNQKLEKWISDRVLKLTCTADDMKPLAEACGFKEGVHKWKPAERAELMAELDAAYFTLYGIKRDDVEYILSTFTGPGREPPPGMGWPQVRELILEAYDGLVRG